MKGLWVVYGSETVVVVVKGRRDRVVGWLKALNLGYIIPLGVAMLSLLGLAAFYSGETIRLTRFKLP
jgi:hypothetical protein